VFGARSELKRRGVGITAELLIELIYISVNKDRVIGVEPSMRYRRPLQKQD
jgi:hypothetical protein